MKNSKKKSADRGLYQDGNKLVIHEDARAPHRCVLCNKPADGERMHFTFARKKSPFMDMAAIESLSRAAGDLLTGAKYTGPVDVSVSMCSWHRKRRLIHIGAGLVLLAIGLVFLLIRFLKYGAAEFDVHQISLPTLIGVVVALGGLALVSTSLSEASKVWLRATKYYDRYVWLSGAGKPFLRTLPRLDQADVKSSATGSIRPESDADDANLSAEELIRRGERHLRDR